jgi:hypothetical protein
MGVGSIIHCWEKTGELQALRGRRKRRDVQISDCKSSLEFAI